MVTRDKKYIQDNWQ